MSDLDPLPHELNALFAAERETYPEDHAARARVQRRLETAIVIGAAAGVGAAAVAAATSAGSAGGSAGASAAEAAGGVAGGAKIGLLTTLSLHAAKHAKLWVGLALVSGVAVGETHARLTAEASPDESARHASSVKPPASTARTTTEPEAPTESAPESPPIAVSSLPSSPASPMASAMSTTVGTRPSGSASTALVSPATSAAPTPSAARASELAAEQGLIDTARAALTRGRGADALQATEDHARRFPRGRLTEEREMLAVQALLLAGRRAEAEARARRFHQAHPQSLYGAAVDALLRPTGAASP